MKSRAKTDYIVVHCAATPPTLDIGKVEIDRWHRAQGWLMIGYHFVIRRDGTIEKGRDVDAIGSHVAGYNSTSVGISLVGGVDANGKPEDNFTSAQFAALAELLIELKAKYPKADILGHRDFSPDRNKDGKITSNEWLKACPSFDVREWLKSTGVLLNEQPIKNPKPVAQGGWLYHEMKSGETVSALARIHKVSITMIGTLNPGVNLNRIKVGQPIRVR